MTTKINKTQTKQLNRGRIYVLATFNNTLVTVTDFEGNTIVWGSSGASGFKGARKATPYAATTTAEYVIKKAKLLGLQEVEVFIKGPGPGRDAVLRYLRNSGLKVTMIADVTPIPHNGCRPRKRRRV
jgi:small subunit ribosomal protein S11